MAKEVLSIRVDADLVAKLDEIAGFTGDTRSVAAEGALELGVEERLKALRLFQNPVFRGLVGSPLSSPRVVLALAKLAREPLTESDAQEMADAFAKLTKAGRRKKGG